MNIMSIPLSQDINKMKARLNRARVNRVLRAWSIYSRDSREIRKMLDVNCSLGKLYRDSNEYTRSSSDVCINSYDSDFLDYVSNCVFSLDNVDASLVYYEYRYHHRDRFEKWSKLNNRSPRTYTDRLRKVKDKLSTEFEKFGRNDSNYNLQIA